MSSMKQMIPNPRPFPSFFFSHGGPTFLYEDADFGNKGAFNTIKNLGNKIKNDWKPDYIIVVSAHWQSSGSNLIEISLPPKNKEENELIYDFYGFPDYMYQEEFHSKFDSQTANIIKQELIKDGFNSELSERGIDHGTWVPFKVAFLNYRALNKEPSTFDLPETSLIQVSLTGNEKDFDKNYKLGDTLSKFRNQLIWDEERQKYLSGLVICSGMSVHNLRDFRYITHSNQVMEYVQPFQDLLKSTLVNDESLLKRLNDLKIKYKSLLYRAHPTLEHFLPIVVASGLVSTTPNESIKELYNANVASLGWGIYQFGNDYKV